MRNYAIEFDKVGKQCKVGAISTDTPCQCFNRWYARLRGKISILKNRNANCENKLSLNLEYVKSNFNMKYDDCEFFVFSDDMAWCKDYIIDKNVTYIDLKCNIGSWNDMYLMSICRHHINANSTFSWWATWLTPYNDSLVVRLHQYINGIDIVDFYPENWIDMIM